MDSADIIRMRLHNQGLTASKFKHADEVVAWLGAVQSQDYDGGKWTVGMRIPGLTEGETERAFRDGDIIRTHVMRPTWHFVAAEDIRWMLALTGPRIDRAMGSYSRKMGLDEAVYGKACELIGRALAEGDALTRAELKAALTAGGIATDPMRLAFLVMRAETSALICSGPRRGKQFTYMLMDKRVLKAKKLEHDEALAELTRRYFASHGPATAHDFGWWSGLTMKDVRAGLALNPKLEQADVGGKTCYFLGGSKAKMAVGPVAHLLQLYDEYLVAYKDRSAVMDPQVSHLESRQWVWAAPFLIDGRVVGSWTRALEGRVRRVEFKYLRKLSTAEHAALDAAVERYADYLCVPLVVSGR